MTALHYDIRHAMRSLAKKPGYAITVIVILALGIGANTAIFSVVNAVLLRPLPFGNPDRIVNIYKMRKNEGIETNMSHKYFAPLREHSQVFKQMAGYAARRFYVTGLDRPRHVKATEVSACYFSVVEAKPLLGRAFLPDEDQPGKDQVMILSYDFWNKHFEADPDAIGRTLNLDDATYTIVGVMPANFRSLYGRPDPFWVPMVLKLGKGFGATMALARLKDDVTFEQAKTHMALVGQRLEQLNPERNRGYTVSIHRYVDDVFGEHRKSLWLLLGTAVCVLLIACANAANLLFARASARMKEIALRKALGASPLRIFGQTLTESLLLSTGAGLVGLLVTYWMFKGLIQLCPSYIPRIGETRIDSAVFCFTLGVSMITGLVCGLIPAGKISTSRPAVLLKAGRAGTVTGGIWARLRSSLVVLQLSISLPLLMGAALLAQSMIERQKVDLGFESESVLVMHIELPGIRYPDYPQWSAFFQQLLERTRALPGVRSAALASVRLDLAKGGNAMKFTIDGRPTVDPGESYEASSSTVGAGYFKTMGIKILAGRGFTDQDGWNAIVIDENLAKHFFPDSNPIGRHINGKPVIGVVSTIRDFRELNPTRGRIYRSRPTDRCYKTSDLIVRTESDPMAVAPALRAQVAALDKDLEISSIEPLEAELRRMLAPQRFSMILLELFAGTALIFVAVGLYSLFQYTVAQRTHEIGIRMAMGATRAAIIRIILTQGGALFLIGAVFGLSGSLAATRLLTGLLYGVHPTDPVILASVVSLLFVVALLACYIPARRAAKVDPMEALRYE